MMSYMNDDTDPFGIPYSYLIITLFRFCGLGDE